MSRGGICHKANLNPRIARWVLRLQNYKFKLSHRVGEKMAHVGSLSQIVSLVGLMPIERELEIHQLQDMRLEVIAKKLEVKDDP